MYASHLGWLHSTPEKSEQTRLKALGEGSQFANMPECDHKALINAFHDLGFAMTSAPISALTFAEISGFKMATGLNLNHFEVVTLKRMSECFVVWINKGKKQGCHAPYYKDNRSVEGMREDVSNKFKALARKKK